ncbi:twitching motility protein PilT [Sphingomonas sp. Leaf407]|uniref:type II toxin-antitoxin system VapC family toxin n=1 Tax=unclassified Sphingomonas TaxID=196159 RepID=UPI0006F41799|nr:MULTISPECIES: type II toxin-antitoxin system VapC family toxin [unclassified Sphingomonas]KQN36428.1 twitching motility protein PilT [Sphingomonas sp. Leaf42]KQT27048.1 twitching motility protein PilT [Sphingomonas sp. Leaf407]
MNKLRYVLDSSALLCVMFEEEGAEHVAARLPGAMISASNYAEVVAKLVDRGMPPADIVTIMADLDIEVVPVDRQQAELAGLMRATTAGLGLSLGDRACLALAQIRRTTALTTDRVWSNLEIDVTVEQAR